MQPSIPPSRQVSDFYDKPWSELVDWYLSPASGGEEPTPRNGVINGAHAARGWAACPERVDMRWSMLCCRGLPAWAQLAGGASYWLTA